MKIFWEKKSKYNITMKEAAHKQTVSSKQRGKSKWEKSPVHSIIYQMILSLFLKKQIVYVFLP
jgi:hypothetical protein